MSKKLAALSVSATAFLLTSPMAFAIEVGDIKGSKGFAANIGSIISTVLSFIMAIAALLVFMYLIWGGIQWITSGGDKGKTEEARNKITAAVIGLIVLAASYAILQIGLNVLGFGSISETFTNVNPIQDTQNISL